MGIEVKAGSEAVAVGKSRSEAESHRRRGMREATCCFPKESVGCFLWETKTGAFDRCGVGRISYETAAAAGDAAEQLGNAAAR